MRRVSYLIEGVYHLPLQLFHRTVITRCLLDRWFSVEGMAADLKERGYGPQSPEYRTALALVGAPLRRHDATCLMCLAAQP